MTESHARSAIKSLSWRCVATATTVTLVYLFTGEIRLALTLGSVELVVKLLVFYFHERAWNSVPWGKAA